VVVLRPTDIRRISGGFETRISLLTALSNGNRLRRKQKAIKAGG
jgi:hypothetical protein